MRILVVSNRLPVAFEQRDGRLEAKPGSGGLVTALAPTLRRLGGTWVGWPGEVRPGTAGMAEGLAAQAAAAGFEIVPVYLSAEEQAAFYQGYANEIIWPLFHDLQSRCNFVPEYWQVSRTVVERFADAVQRSAQPGDFLWVHDYHLMMLGGNLRARGIRSGTGFFLHIPFPAPDIFAKLPWRAETLDSLLAFDLIGLQTPRDRENFLDCVRRLVPEAQVHRAGGGLLEVVWRDHAARVGVFPIGIDFHEFAAVAASPAVAERARALRALVSQLPGAQILLGVDRLDYTKGIPERLKAFRLALRRHPELRRAVTLLQLVIPSRTRVPEYRDLLHKIERLVAEVNGEFTEPGWVPVQYMFRSMEREELIACYRAADVAVVTPLKDGMNLVAKEYCACQTEGDGVLILSEFAGAAVQFRRGAILVNPYDLDGVAAAIREAVLRPAGARKQAMNRLRSIVRRQNVHVWAHDFLAAAGVAAGGGA